ncbi:hypothetical protein [Mucilaginibacter sp.]|uniref:glycoside hydrolase family 130 protein n=1 Tax=Mucilaginibacter sp. TaxID=1882438 RepID=UPI00374CFE3B
MRLTKDDAHELRYAAGLIILDKEYPQRILYRSPNPVLSPDFPEERVGLIANVVFPTGIDRRDGLDNSNGSMCITAWRITDRCCATGYT